MLSYGDGMKKNKIGKICILALFIGGMLFTGLSFAEKITLRSSLIWSKGGDYTFRKGGQADDNLKYNYSGSLIAEEKTGIYESACTTLENRVESVTVNWFSQGNVKIEVSANGGLDYVSVVNGVPLNEGFRKGNKICWRAKLGPGSRLDKVQIDYKDDSGVITGFGNPALEGFKYRKLVYINNNTDKDLFNYQAKVVLGESDRTQDYDVQCDGNIKNDFIDVRFTAADGQNDLAYYLEEIKGNSPSRKAVFWIKVPHLPANYLLPIYVYYGNSEASDTSSGQKVFSFFDDFSGQGLDLDKWVVLSEGEYSIDSSLLKLNGTQSFSRDFKVTQGIIEYKAMIEKGNEMRTFVSGKRADGYQKATHTFYSSTYEGAEHSVAIDDIVRSNASKSVEVGKYYLYRSFLSGDEIIFQRFNDASGEKEAETICNDKEGVVSGHVGLKAASGTVVYFDWIRVRKAPLEGVVVTQKDSQGTTTAGIDLPQFKGVRLAGNGNIELKDNFTQGEYVLGNIGLLSSSRIFESSWESEDGISMKVSFTGGSDYSQECEQDKVYYASKGDFIAGKKLKFKAGFNFSDETNPVLKEVTLDCRPGAITVVNPGLNEQLAGGKEYKILWSAKDYEDEYLFVIEYSLDNGKTYRTIAESVENTGSYTWNVPNVISSLGKIKVSDYFSPDTAYDESPGNFQITGDSLVTQPDKPMTARQNIVKTQPEKTELETDTKKKENVFKDIDINKLLQKGKRLGTKLYDVVIKVGDNTNPSSLDNDRGSYKHGDVVIIKPTGHQWTETEKNSFLIIQLYLRDSELHQLLRPKTRLTGRTDKEGNWLRETVGRRSEKIDLEKLGLSEKELNQRNQAAELEKLSKELEGKPLKTEELIERK